MGSRMRVRLRPLSKQVQKLCRRLQACRTMLKYVDPATYPDSSVLEVGRPHLRMRVITGMLAGIT